MAAITPSTNLKLLKCPLTLDEKNQLTFNSAADQYNYFNSLPKKEVDDFSYQRENGIIRFEAEIDTILEYNYVMYQNENYSNKWFYAFITNMRYINDNMTEISINTDSFQTWQFDLTYKRSFIEREHVNNDTIGANLIPERLEHGEYVMAANYDRTNLFTHVSVCVECTKHVAVGITSYGEMHNKIFSGSIKYLFRDSQSGTPAAFYASNFIQYLDSEGWGENITGVYMIPEDFTYDATWYPMPDGSAGEYGISDSTYALIPYYENINVGTNVPSTLAGGYIPRNNKLFTYPYRYCLVSNSAGIEVPMYYENFNNSQPVFELRGAICPGCSIKLIPVNYKGLSLNLDEAIGLGKAPICSWTSDMYTNWLTQNSLNITYQTVGIGAKVIGGSVASVFNPLVGAGALVSAGADIFNLMKEDYEHSLIPNQTQGNVNVGDVNFSNDNLDYFFYHYSIKPEFARAIDSYFDSYGYAINNTKVPNITGRANWNYVKTIGANIIGNIPQADLQSIKNMFDAGITLWHNPSTFLDYSQNNGII